MIYTEYGENGAKSNKLEVLMSKCLVTVKEATRRIEPVLEQIPCALPVHLQD